MQRFRRYLRPGRGVLLIVTVHLVAFHILYLSLIRLVEREVALAHGAEVRDTVFRVMGSIHPALASGNRDDLVRAVNEARTKDNLLALNFIRRADWAVMLGKDGAPIISSHKPDQEGVIGLKVEKIGQRWNLSGTVPIVATSHCGSCHDVGSSLGAAIVRIDISDQVDVPKARLKRNAATLVIAWVLGLGMLNLSARWIATRRFRRFKADIEGDELSHARRLESVLPTTLDRVSAEMYESLFEALQQVCEREERVTARIHHTERLASLGQIAAGLAHEIKNPLAGIRGALELMRDEDEEGKGRRELYQQMIGEMDRVHEILHSLLRFARPSPPRRVQTDVRSLVEECVGLMAHGLRRKGIILTAEIAPNLGMYSLDVAQIRQVLVNLINNAGEAIGKDGTIKVRATTFPQGDGLILAVEDNGPGMSEEQLSKIFQPFFTTKFSGTGLGLAVSRSIVLEHGGTLEARSNPGEGAGFFILLSEKAADEASASPSELPEQAESESAEEIVQWP